MRRRPSFLTTVLVAPFLLTLPAPSALQAQSFTQVQTQGVWVQVEAAPTLTQAQDRTRAYAARLPDVAGYDLGNGWYSVVLGPYSPQDAEAVLRRLRALGDIPADSYLTTGETFARQYWPIGAAANQGLRPVPEGLGGLTTTPEPSLPPPVVTGDAMLDALAADLAAALAETTMTTPESDPLTPETPAPDALITDAVTPDAMIEVEADTALPEASAGTGATTTPPPLPEVTFPNALPDESEREAAASEALLSRPEKEDLQTALRWAGFYSGAIDGAYGRGTRSAMSAWQSAHGLPATGILTTRERGMVLDSYNADLSGLDLAVVSDPEAGVEVLMPLAVVSHSATDAPFVTYDGTGTLPGAQVLLLSQPGDARRLAGLYEIMQTLDAVPPTGPRSLTADGFTIQGSDGRVQSYSHAVLVNGQIKGFTLVWPAGDMRFTRLWNEMRAAFRPIAGGLPEAQVAQDDLTQLDLAAGLTLRVPQAVGAGMFLNQDGAILTDASLVGQCERIEVAGGHPARISHSDAGLGIAVLAPDTKLAPSRVAQFALRGLGIGERLSVAGFPYGAALLTPTLTYGTAAGAGGLSGEAHLARLTMSGAQGDAGGPILDGSGAVVGQFSWPVAPAGQILPADLALVRHSEAITTSLRSAGIAFETAAGAGDIPAATLTRQASEMVVQVMCW